MQEQPTGHHDDDICGSLWMDIQLMQSDISFRLVNWQVAPVVMASLLAERNC